MQDAGSSLASASPSVSERPQKVRSLRLLMKKIRVTAITRVSAMVYLAAIMFAALLASSKLHAQSAGSVIPQVMAFQGYVATDTGAFSGITPVTLTLYDSIVSGNEVWSQSWPDTVHVQQGYYSVVMDFRSGVHWEGANSGFTKQYWLDANVQGQDLSPRVQLTASPYSFVADTALHVASSVPIGTIEAYGLDILGQVDSNWLPCDGRMVKRSDYPLFATRAAAIYGSSGDNVYLPDLRGLFLRGVNDGRTDSLADPDSSKRIAPNHGALAIDLVGSVEPDAFQGHWHYADGIAPRVDTNSASSYEPAGEVIPKSIGDHSYPDVDNKFVLDPTSDGTHGTPRFSSETRPKNSYVYWIIKVK
jgi:Phage Tail Collar Domain